MKKILLVTLCFLLLVSCDKLINKSDNKIIKFDNIEGIELKKINKEGFGNSFLAVLSSHESTGTDGLWIVKNTNNELFLSKKVKSVSDKILRVECVSISQGDFIEIYDSTHMGNGGMKLVSWDDLTNPKYEFTGVVDKHYEIEEKTGCSKVFADGYLSSFYYDVDSDGRTDVVFEGIQWLVDDNIESSYFGENIMKTTFIKWVYLYNSQMDMFCKSEELSKEIYIN